MALISIVGESGDPLNVLLVDQIPGTIVNIMTDNYVDGMEMVGSSVQGVPSHTENDSGTGMMILPPVSKGSSVIGSNIITPVWNN